VSESDELGLSFAPELGWHPVRHLLGITAFGMNAYTCHADGGPLIEEHDELGAPRAATKRSTSSSSATPSSPWTARRSTRRPGRSRPSTTRPFDEPLGH
jgi:hypothetical protein